MTPTNNGDLYTCSDEFNSNFAGLHVYIPNRSYRETIEVEQYSWETLMANIGGNLGLFMGISLITIVDCVEFLWEMILYFSKTKNQQKTKPIHLKSSSGWA
ncbi:degenerin-like protein asic-1 [Limulus polyphemus]|uniref:Degenerin-like protein asic-1 n=1 Tax=Limulus polyphemus TaxID=6850 RepID=A0ABM1THS9_LIMPO|nr:degenerin-like protein asic-1 [Limulus polyphemus]